jgi:hypothetical protein
LPAAVVGGVCDNVGDVTHAHSPFRTDHCRHTAQKHVCRWTTLTGPLVEPARRRRAPPHKYGPSRITPDPWNRRQGAKPRLASGMGAHSAIGAVYTVFTVAPRRTVTRRRRGTGTSSSQRGAPPPPVNPADQRTHPPHWGRWRNVNQSYWRRRRAHAEPHKRCANYTYILHAAEHKKGA